METWNREELYAEVWEHPLVKVAPKYGISAVALGKVCRKLQIPLPGRGYWIKKEFGKPVERLPLPQAKDLPIVQRFKFPSSEQSPSPVDTTPEETPTDPEFLRIVDLESRNIVIDPHVNRHILVKATVKAMRGVQPDEKGILHPRYDEPCLEVRISKAGLELALAFMNAVWARQSCKALRQCHLTYSSSTSALSPSALSSSSLLSTKPCVLPFWSVYAPTMSPSGLMPNGRVLLALKISSGVN